MICFWLGPGLSFPNREAEKRKHSVGPRRRGKRFGKQPVSVINGHISLMELSRLMLACVVKCYSNAIPSQRDNGSDAKHGLIGEAAQILHESVFSKALVFFSSFHGHILKQFLILGCHSLRI